MTTIHLSKADVTAAERELVAEAMESGWIAPLGPHVDAFEAEIAGRAGVARALALSSGTAALHLALLGVGVRPGSAVIVPTMTFSASANPVVYAGAEPVFVDCRDDGNIDPEQLERALVELEGTGQPVSAVMSVDLFGRCADYHEILALLEDRELPLVEDAAEAVGATYFGRPAGSFGRAAAYSFNGNKIMTTSGGGMLLSDDVELVNRARYLSTQARQPAAHYEHTEIGFNYRLSNVLAALGRAQLQRLDSMIERRRYIRDAYASALGVFDGVRLLGRDSVARTDAEDNCWLSCVEFDPALNLSPDKLIEELGAEGIEARHIWKPMHLQPVFKKSKSFTTGRAERLFHHGLALPSGSGLTDGDVDRVISVLTAVLARKV